MTRWRTTASLARGLTVGALGVGVALLLGRPAVVVLVAPVILMSAAALLAKPRTEPHVVAQTSYAVLHEGQGTTAPLTVVPEDDVEFVTRVCASAAYVALRPASGCLGYLVDRPVPLLVSPRRWGQRRIGEEKVGLFTPWAGYRWGPVGLVGREVSVLPAAATYRAAADAPAPIGLIGAHRSRRDGDGTEFSSIRQFHAGDRMRRINWRVSLRTGALHVVSTRSEEDTAVLLVVDALADYGLSGGVDGVSSSLDVAMRAAAAIAEQYIRQGDRVSLRVVSPHGEYVGYGAGSGHLRRIQGQLLPGAPGRPPRRECRPDRLPDDGGHHGGGAQPDALARHGHVRRPAAAPGPAGDRGRHVARRRRAHGVRRDRPRDRRPRVADAADRAPAGPRAAGRRRHPGRAVERAAHPRRGRAAARAAEPAPSCRGGGPMIRDLTPGGWALRAVVLLGPPVALLAASPQGFVPPVWLIVVVTLASAGFAAFPEQYAGSVAMLLVVGWWATSVRHAMPGGVVVSAAALLAAHVGATVSSYGPRKLPPERLMVLRWVRRTVLLWLVSPLLWLVVDAEHGHTTPASYWLAGLAVALVLAVAVATLYPTRLDEVT